MPDVSTRGAAEIAALGTALDEHHAQGEHHYDDDQPRHGTTVAARAPRDMSPGTQSRRGT